MEIETVRRENLRRYRDRQKLKSVELANKLGKSAAQINSIIGKNPRRGIGGTLAREIEKKLNKPKGWLDILQMSDDDEPNLGYVAITEFIPPQPLTMGRSKVSPEPITRMTVSDSWLQINIDCDPDQTYIASHTGQAMSPNINHGDLMFLDASVKEFTQDGIYLVRVDCDKILAVRRIRWTPDGPVMSADNPNFSTKEVPINTIKIEIIARVAGIMKIINH